MKAIAATGLLSDFAEAGVLGLPDVHLARTLTGLVRDAAPEVGLAIALTLRAWRTGSPCLDVTRADVLGIDDEETTPDTAGLGWPEAGPWLDALRQSPLIGTGDDDRPLCLDGSLLYLRRTWLEQQQVVRSLAVRWAMAPPAPPAGSTGDDVIDAVLNQWTCVLTGGPGTGKTHKVAELIEAVTDLAGFAQIAVAAPTGKAAARLAQAMGPGAPVPVTLHRLLGARGPGRGFRFGAGNPLPADLVIVDELSMVSLPLMAALLSALRPATRLLLVGDPGQLASVEAGAVLADLVAADVTATAHGNTPLVRMLTHVWRYGGALADLSSAAAVGDADRALGVLDRQDPAAILVDRDAAGVTWNDLPDVAGAIRATTQATRLQAEAGEGPAAVAALDGHRLLCAHRQGPYGVSVWARRVAELTTPPGRRADDWWAGKPVLATVTAPDLGVVSGDQGVAIATPDGLRLAFDSRGANGMTSALLPVDAVPSLATLDAMTVHKSQGSQFRAVTVVLPPLDSPLLIRPLLYTAMTRASEQLTVIGTREQLRQGLVTAPGRASGLAAALREATIDAVPSESGQAGCQLRSSQSD